ncbi:hypothetical protein M5689_003021 [Euphorbia peplus]|nr:hypothetical protein M5689_003021 [Euphorbia peplus]
MTQFDGLGMLMEQKKLSLFHLSIASEVGGSGFQRDNLQWSLAGAERVGAWACCPLDPTVIPEVSGKGKAA